jgi:hypothetical protein
MQATAWTLLLCGLCNCCAGPPSDAAHEVAAVHSRAHAHNDYLNGTPLRHALDCGFGSVEADVFLDGGELRVGHDRWMLRPGRTLERLYLDPLLARVRQNGGAVHPGSTGFTLLVDIKADGAAVWGRLREVLSSYRDMLTVFRTGRVEGGAVTVLLSGDRPRTLGEEPERWAALDGRVADLERNPDPALVPLVSAPRSEHFRWQGGEPMPEAERQHMVDLVRSVHGQGRWLRFWGAPDREDVWVTQWETGVDLIGTDRVRALASWMARQGR